MPVTAEEKSQTCALLSNHVDQKQASPKIHLTSEKLSIKYAHGLVVMKSNSQIKELQTIIRDSKTSRTDFIFHSDRLIRLVLEEGLNQLPFEECTVFTHTGEAMEKGLRECCRSIRIGKILMTIEDESESRQVIYARFPPDIDQRKVMLMYPLLKTGSNVTLGVNTLLDYGVPEENIYVLSLFATPKSIEKLFAIYPKIRLLTTEVHDDVPIHFGDRYFGTE